MQGGVIEKKSPVLPHLGSARLPTKSLEGVVPVPAVLSPLGKRCSWRLQTWVPKLRVSSRDLSQELNMHSVRLILPSRVRAMAISGRKVLDLPLAAPKSPGH